MSNSSDECPHCQTRRNGSDRFCEVDGYDFVDEKRRAVAPSWEAVVVVDRSYFVRLAPDGVECPADVPARTVAISGNEVRIGRRSRSRGLEPEIDLSAPPEDPGVSHLHARLILGHDGVYALIDPGSTNGTTMNGDPTPVPTDTPITVTDGDRIHVGAWTTITIRVVPSSD